MEIMASFFFALQTVLVLYLIGVVKRQCGRIHYRLKQIEEHIGRMERR